MRARNSALQIVPPAPVKRGIERHYSVQEIAAAWSLSTKTIRRLFEHEPGVLHINNAGNGKQIYTTLRIPESVLMRAHKTLSTPF